MVCMHQCFLPCCFSDTHNMIPSFHLPQAKPNEILLCMPYIPCIMCMYVWGEREREKGRKRKKRQGEMEGEIGWVNIERENTH